GALCNMNDAVCDRATALGLHDIGDMWRGSLDSLAARQMKWVYPLGDGDDQFLNRATLTSTFVVDEIVPKRLREVLAAFGTNLHLKDPSASGSGTLGSRNLLQRLALVSVLLDRLDCSPDELPTYVRQAEAVKTDRGAT